MELKKLYRLRNQPKRTPPARQPTSNDASAQKQDDEVNARFCKLIINRSSEPGIDYAE